MFEIGNSLREARMRQGLDFPQVEQATKIRGKYLRALEEEAFDTLPAQTYVKGFLRAYADQLGLDGQLYVDEYNSRYVVDASEEFFRPRRSPQRVRQQRRLESRVVALALLGIVAVTALVIVAWRYGGGSSTSVLPQTPATTAPVGAPTQAHLVVRAVHGSSMVEVHRTSALGVPLFAGTLQPGELQGFTAKRLWLRLRVPSALRVTVNGVRVTLPKHGPVVGVATKHGFDLVNG